MIADVQCTLFSDYFKISPNILEEYGAFNVSLVADLPLFIDPFLIFKSPKLEHQVQHHNIIKYLTFLRDKSVDRQLDIGLLSAWFSFSEVKQTWLGFSREGNNGSGLGSKFGTALYNNFYRMFGDDALQISQGKHLEKLCLIAEGVGRDNISDFTTNLVKAYLLDYTQQFARTHLQPHQYRRFPVVKVSFNYEMEHWDSAYFDLPHVMTRAKNGYIPDYVILVPKELLTSDDTWINRTDLINTFDAVPESMMDGALRAEFNNYLLKALPDAKTKKIERRKIIEEVLEQYPDFVDHYIKYKEDTGDEAVAISNAKVVYAESLFLENYTKLATLLVQHTDFYKFGNTSLEDARGRITHLKHAIEENEGYIYLYDTHGDPIPTEHELSILYPFLWLNNPQNEDTSKTEPINQPPILPQHGGVRIAFKLAGSNNRLKTYLNKQADAASENAKKRTAISVIFCFSNPERQVVESYLHEVKGSSHEVFLINAYKPQESNGAEMTNDISGFASGYALVIGVANYAHINRLPSIVLDDARDIYKTLRERNYCGYDEQNMRLLLDQEATAQNIRDGLEWLANTAGESDTVVIYFSGHGGSPSNDADKQTYLLPFDCRADDLPATSLSSAEITTSFNSIKCQKMLVLLDSCHSGSTGDPKAVLPTSDFKAGLSEDYYNQLARGKGRVIIASSRGDEVSYVLAGMANSLFTHYLLKALHGEALTRGDGLMRVLDIFSYVSEHVPAQAQQHPVFKATDVEDNFPVSLYQGGKKQVQTDYQALPPTANVDERTLREAIMPAFSLEELEMLCADIEQDLRSNNISTVVNLEEIGGQSKGAKVMKLIQYLERRNHIQYLINAVRRVRPNTI